MIIEQYTDEFKFEILHEVVAVNPTLSIDELFVCQGCFVLFCFVLVYWLAFLFYYSNICITWRRFLFLERMFDCQWHFG